MHAGTIGVEDTNNLDVNSVLAVIVEEESFGTSLSFIIAGTWSDGIDIAPVLLRLRVNCGIAIDLACRGLEDSALQAFCKPQHVDCSMHRGLRCLHRIVLIVNGGCWTGKVVDFIYLNKQRKAHIVTKKLESWMIVKVVDISLGAGEQIVCAKHFVTLLKKPVNEV
jgi:hypothetical protein